MIRLNKFISESGYCSRRKADEIIDQGKVFVNGKIAHTGMQVSYDAIVIIDGKRIERTKDLKIVLFYKPSGYACTAHRGDQSSIFRNFDLENDLKYVGRLDKDSEGLLVLTNNGDLCNEISKARNCHEKEYIVTVNRLISSNFIQGMQSGVSIFNPNKNNWVKTKPCKVKKIKNNQFSIILTQGLNRQIRRMCEQFGFKVSKLCRIRVMNFLLGDMKPGEIREATKEEIETLQRNIKFDFKN